MNKENTILTLAVAACTSVVVILATSRTTPVLMFTAGLIIFTLILNTGWKAAGVESYQGLGAWSFISLWLCLALLIWFAFLSGGFWLWILAAAAICAWVTTPWKHAKRPANES